MQTYTPAEIRAVLRAADKDRNGHLWYLALSGLRRGEIAGLQWGDIDFDAGTLAVARTRVELGNGPTTVVENEPKTFASRRTLPLDEGLLAVLRRASARYAQEKLALGRAHRQRLRCVQRGRAAVYAGGADAYVAGGRQDGRCAAGPAA